MFIFKLRLKFGMYDWNSTASLVKCDIFEDQCQWITANGANGELLRIFRWNKTIISFWDLHTIYLILFCSSITVSVSLSRHQGEKFLCSLSLMLLNCRYHWIAPKRNTDRKKSHTKLNTFTDSDNVLKGFDFYFHFNAISHLTSAHRNTMYSCGELCKQTVELENVEIHINPILFRFFFFDIPARIKLNYLPVVIAFPLHMHCHALPGSSSA